MRLKTWLIVGGGVLCLGLLMFGQDAWSYVASARHFTRTVIKDRIPEEVEIARLRTMLSGLDKTIDRRRRTLVDMQLQAESLEKELACRRATLATDRAALDKAANLLDDKQETYTIGGYTYTYAEVDADARIKATKLRQDQDMLAARENTLSRATEAIATTRGVLSNTEVERQKLTDKVDRLEIRAASLRTTTEIATEHKYGKDESLGTAYQRIQKAVTDLDHRLTKGERLIEVKRTGDPGINYARKEDHQSGLDAIQEVLQ